MRVYNEKQIKVRVKEFNCVININYLDHEVPKECVHDTSIAYLSIDSVMKMEKKNYPQVYFEKWNHKIKKKQIPGFIDVELAELDSSSDFEWFYLSAYWGSDFRLTRNTRSR